MHTVSVFAYLISFLTSMGMIILTLKSMLNLSKWDSRWKSFKANLLIS